MFIILFKSGYKLDFYTQNTLTYLNLNLKRGADSRNIFIER